MELIKYRDAGMQTHTYFWKNENDQMVSPFFDSEAEAMAWTNQKPEPNPRENRPVFPSSL